MFRKLTLACLTTAALVAASLTATVPASAEEIPDEPAIVSIPEEYADLSGEEIVEIGLEEEGLEAETVEVGLDGIEIEASAIDPADDFSFALALDAGSTSGTYTVTDEIDGETVTTVFDVNILESTSERSVFELTNPETGETELFDSDTAATSVAFVIPIAFAAVSLSTALYYLAIGAAIIIGGALALEAAKAVSKIIAENNRKSSNQKRDYYPAARGDNGKVFISPNGLTKAQALTRGKAASDVWAISQTKAKALCKDLNVSGTPVGKEKHGTGYLWHFHPYKHKPNMHCFFGSPA